MFVVSLYINSMSSLVQTVLVIHVNVRCSQTTADKNKIQRYATFNLKKLFACPRDLSQNQCSEHHCKVKSKTIC